MTSFRAGMIRWIAAGALGAVLWSPPAHGQSAADKATARQLALDAIKLFKAGKHADALDKMQRAQSLYDAPIHLLYIARSQEKVGQLVEASETYRNLIRTNLDAGAPEAFVTAVEDGKKELAALEPRIPSLRVDVTPPNVADLDLRIDGNKVSAAVVGVDRPANPGSHTIRVAAPGFQAAEKTIQLQEKQSLTVPLELQPDAGAAVAPVPVGAGGGTGASAGPAPAPAQPGDGDGAPKERSGLGFMVGLRMGAAIPGGSLIKVAGDEVPLTDFTKNGFGGGLNGGVRFLDHFTPMIYAEGYVHGVGPGLDQVPSPGVELTTTISHRAAGLGLMAHTKRGKFGGFGELGLGLLHEFVVVEEASGSGQSCTIKTTLSGGAFRLGGGAMIPLGGDQFHLTPFANLSLATFTTVDVNRSGAVGDCAALLSAGGDAGALDADTGKTEIPESAQAGHSVFTIGVGGSFLFGGG